MNKANESFMKLVYATVTPFLKRWLLTEGGERRLRYQSWLYSLAPFGLQVIETQFEPVGVQNMCPQNRLLCHFDFVELKVLEKQVVQKGYSEPALSPKTGYKCPIGKLPTFFLSHLTTFLNSTFITTFLCKSL